MRRRIGKPGIPALIFFAVLVVALIVGVIVPGGTGDTIAAIAGGILALTILATMGIGKAAGDAVDRRGRRRF
jgi:uncharacterized membrane protein